MTNELDKIALERMKQKLEQYEWMLNHDEITRRMLRYEWLLRQDYEYPTIGREGVELRIDAAIAEAEKSHGHRRCDNCGTECELSGRVEPACYDAWTPLAPPATP